MNHAETAPQNAPAAQVSPVRADRDGATVARLLMASFLMLFLELALIRWLGANIVHLSYFSNFVLLGSFLGIGAGFLVSRHERSIWPVSLPLLAILVAGVLLFPVSIQRAGSDVIYFTALAVAGPPAWVALPLVFGLVALILAGPAELVGRCFGKLPPLSAYRYDLLGSLAGIVVFSLLSFLRAPSVAWGAIAALFYLLLAERGTRRVLAAVAAAVLLAMLAIESLTPGVSWSPYYKVRTEEIARTDAGTGGPGFLLIKVNGVPHQVMAPAKWKMGQAERIYEEPYLRLPGKADGDVLIIGAGSGSDVAIALSEGARHIDAVDIDPRIMEIGMARNIDRPYADPRVTRHINDGRAFLESTDKKYDLILFALPDSLTLVSGASQIRLESFLFTLQAMESVKRHLKPNGGFAMYNYYREPWLIDRLAGTVAAGFGHPPCVDTYAGAQAVISVAMNPPEQKCPATWTPTPGRKAIPPATDNAPFLYFKGGTFPPLYSATLD